MKTMPTDLLKKELKKGKADRSRQWHDCKDIQMFLLKHARVETVDKRKTKVKEEKYNSRKMKKKM